MQSENVQFYWSMVSVNWSEETAADTHQTVGRHHREFHSCLWHGSKSTRQKKSTKNLKVLGNNFFPMTVSLQVFLQTPKR